MIVRWLIRLCVALAAIALANGESTLNINNVLNRRNITEKKGMACAYADFNQDRNIDILHYHKGKLYVLLQITETFLGAKDFSDMGDTENTKWEIDLGEEYAEVACSVGDINYDGLTDIVVSTRKTKGENGHWTVRYFYSAPDTTSSSNSSRFVQGLNIIKAKHQVALIDVTGDGIHDLVGIQEDGENLLCLKGSETSDNVLNDACEGIFLNWTGSLHPLMPILYGDVNNDRFAELVFMKHDKEGLKPEIWSREGSIWVVDPKKQLPPPPSSVSFKHTLAPLLFDYNSDAKMDIVVPVCKDEKCTTIDSIQTTFMNGNEWDKWTTITVDLGGNTIVEEDDTLVRMKAGDYNLDGFPDLLVTIGNAKGGNNYAAVLYNNPPENRDTSKWKFEKQTEMLIMPGLSLGMIQTSSFFDFAEDGNLDILVQWKSGNDWEWSLCISQTEKQDATFLKVQTFSPLQSGTIMEKENAKGVVWGGTCVTYEMETTGLGEKSKAIECQVPANSHKAGLSPPFVLFGLGRNPNFIDQAEIGVPRLSTSNDEKDQMRYHVQKQIVPNARMMVQPPNGKDNNRNWILRLFLTPSSLIFSSLIVMAAVCVILLIVVIILHYREKKVDRVERAAQSHRFHFDAM